jgi:hypothetical protein
MDLNSSWISRGQTRPDKRCPRRAGSLPGALVGSALPRNHVIEQLPYQAAFSAICEPLVE